MQDHSQNTEQRPKTEAIPNSLKLNKLSYRQFGLVGQQMT